MKSSNLCFTKIGHFLLRSSIVCFATNKKYSSPLLFTAKAFEINNRMVTATRSSSLMIQQPPKKRFLGSRNVHSKLFSKEESVSKPTPPVVSPSPKKKSSSSRRLKVGENELNGNLDTFDDNGNNNSLKFQDLCVPPSELRPSTTLTTGQCFHWKVIDATTRTNAARNNESEDDDDDDDSPTTSRSKGEGKSSAWGIHNATEWVGVLRLPSGESLALVIRETESTTLYRVLKGPSNSDFNCSSFLKSYFQLDEPLEELYSEWSGNCNRLAQIASCIQGVRIVDQDPWECLVSFICSSNNNIPRITKMLAAIRREYGDPLVTFKEEDNEKEEVLYSFPSLKTLSAKATEDGLRKIGLGYRAKYLMETMETLESLGGEPYLQELRSISEPILVQEKLIQFKGVGRKVADCIALFSLKQDRAIPVDVHVWNIAQRDYDPTLENVKSLTPTVYRQVGDLFRSQFPVKSGWAHSLLFVAELPSFRPALPEELVKQMDKFRAEEQEKKSKARATKRKRAGAKEEKSKPS